METQLRAAIGSFFTEFSKFEVTSVGMALQSLARDPAFVERTEQLLNLQGRLKLLERMAFSRGVPPALIAELTQALSRAKRLLDKRDAVARSLEAIDSGITPVEPTDVPRGMRLRYRDIVPPIAQLRENVDESVDLQATMRAIARKIDPFMQATADR